MVKIKRSKSILGTVHKQTIAEFPLLTEKVKKEGKGYFLDFEHILQKGAIKLLIYWLYRRSLPETSPDDPKDSDLADLAPLIELYFWAETCEIVELARTLMRRLELLLSGDKAWLYAEDADQIYDETENGHPLRSLAANFYVAKSYLHSFEDHMKDLNDVWSVDFVRDCYREVLSRLRAAEGVIEAHSECAFNHAPVTEDSNPAPAEPMGVVKEEPKESIEQSASSSCKKRKLA